MLTPRSREDGDSDESAGYDDDSHRDSDGGDSDGGVGNDSHLRRDDANAISGSVDGAMSAEDFSPLNLPDPPTFTPEQMFDVPDQEQSVSMTFMFHTRESISCNLIVTIAANRILCFHTLCSMHLPTPLTHALTHTHRTPTHKHRCTLTWKHHRCLSKS